MTSIHLNEDFNRIEQQEWKFCAVEKVSSKYLCTYFIHEKLNIRHDKFKRTLQILMDTKNNKNQG